MKRLTGRVALRFAPLAFTIAVITGCGDTGPTIVEIQGTVTRNGAPLRGFEVHFDPETGRPSRGVTDEQGHYALEYTSKIAGAVTGKHKVYVWYFPKDPNEARASEEGRWKPSPEIKAVLDKYGPQNTPLTFDITESQTIDLKLD